MPGRSYLSPRHDAASVAPIFILRYDHENNWHWSLLPIRIPPRLGTTLEVPVDMFCLAELVQAFCTQFSSHAAHFEATDRPAIVISPRIVDPECTPLDCPAEPFLLDRARRNQVHRQAIR